MFGTILADHTALTPEQHKRYRSLYCGLCRTLHREYGIWARLTLSYDMTFLIILLSSLYEPDEISGTRRCAIHPMKPHLYAINPYTSYAAAMNVSLSYYKAMDNWQDDHNLFAFLMSAILRRSLKKAETCYPHTCQAISAGLRSLSELEQKKINDPDAAAACFGGLVGSVFAAEGNDHWSPSLQRLGDSLGRFVYLLDALIDLEQDLKKCRYNSLKGHISPGNEEDFLPALRLYIGDCANELERLPLVQDLDILRNIIYSGIWIPYEKHRRKKAKRRDTHV